MERVNSIQKIWQKDYIRWAYEAHGDLLKCWCCFFFVYFVSGMIASGMYCSTKTCFGIGATVSATPPFLFLLCLILSILSAYRGAARNGIAQIWWCCINCLFVCRWKTSSIPTATKIELQSLRKDLELGLDDFHVNEIPNKLHEVQVRLFFLETQHREVLIQLPKLLEVNLVSIPSTLHPIICDYV